MSDCATYICESVSFAVHWLTWLLILGLVERMCREGPVGYVHTPVWLHHMTCFGPIEPKQKWSTSLWTFLFLLACPSAWIPEWRKCGRELQLCYHGWQHEENLTLVVATYLWPFITALWSSTCSIQGSGLHRDAERENHLLQLLFLLTSCFLSLNDMYSLLTFTSSAPRSSGIHCPDSQARGTVVLHRPSFCLTVLGETPLGG